MVNARQAALAERRTTTKRKVLRPGSLSSAADSIARKMADAQFESMVKRYNDGVVSNEEMFSYLQSASSNPFFTEMDKVNINDKLRDFEVAVNGEHLEANFQSTEGAEKITAARALAAYYNERANNLESGTPAHSKALQDVANWKGKAETVYEDIKKEERKMARAQMEYQIALLPPGVESLKQQSEAYQKLAIEAGEDGENIDAMDWATKAQEIMNDKLPKAMADEVEDEVSGRLSILKSNYERGVISATDARIELDSLDEMAQENGLWNKMSSIDELTQKIGEDDRKGVSVEEFEGRTYTIRRADGSEMTTSIKDRKAQFQEEDDRFRAMLYDSGLDQSPVERHKDFIYLYALYLNGGGDETTGQFFGLKNRRDLYLSWAEQVPDKAYGYEESARNTDAQVTSKTDKMSQYIRTLGAYAGDTDEEVNQLLGSVTKLYEGQAVNFEGRQATGQLITKDKDGFQDGKFVPLNTQVEVTDDQGNTTLVDTKVGSSIGKVPGEHNVYVKLEPFYLEGEIPGKFHTYSYAEYNGELYIQNMIDFDGELQRASDLAKTDGDVRRWYENPDENGVAWRDYEAQNMKEYFDRLTTEGQQKYQEKRELLYPTKDVIGDGQGEVDTRTPVDLAPQNGPLDGFVQNLRDSVGQNKLDISRDPYSAVGTGDPIDFSQFKDIKFDTPTLQPSSPRTYTPTTFTPSPIDFSKQLTSPKYTPSPLQSSGFTMDLPKDEWKPPTSNLLQGPSVKDVVGKVGSTIKSGISSVGNWLKKIKMPWDN